MSWFCSVCEKSFNAGLNPFQTVPIFSQKCQRSRFEHPVPSIIAGMTGSGKTAWVRSLLQQASETIYPSPERIVWCYSQWQSIVVFFSCQLIVIALLISASSSTATTCTATPQQLHTLVQVLYNILMGHISIPEENKRILLLYKNALLDLARPNVPHKTKKPVLVQEGSGFIDDVVAPVDSSLGFLML